MILYGSRSFRSALFRIASAAGQEGRCRCLSPVENFTQMGGCLNFVLPLNIRETSEFGGTHRHCHRHRRILIESVALIISNHLNQFRGVPEPALDRLFQLRSFWLRRWGKRVQYESEGLLHRDSNQTAGAALIPHCFPNKVDRASEVPVIEDIARPKLSDRTVPQRLVRLAVFAR